MAKPSGAPVAGDVWWNVFDHANDDDDDIYMYFVALSHPSITQYNDEDRGDQMCRVQMADFVTVEGAGSSMTRDWYVHGGWLSASNETEATHSDDWTSAVTDLVHPDSSILTSTGLGNATEGPFFIMIECKITIDGDGSDCYMNAVEIEEIHDDAFGDGVAEVIERTTAADRTYIPDMPCTSWHVMNVIADTYNKLTYETLTHYSIPVFGWQPVAPE